MLYRCDRRFDQNRKFTALVQILIYVNPINDKTALTLFRVGFVLQECDQKRQKTHHQTHREWILLFDFVAPSGGGQITCRYFIL